MTEQITTDTLLLHHVLAHEACPRCGEGHKDALRLDDDLDTFTCLTCGKVYVPMSPRGLADLALRCPDLIDWRGPHQSPHDEVTYDLLTYSQADIEITHMLGRLLAYQDRIERKVRRVVRRFEEDGILPIGLHDDSGIWPPTRGTP